MKTKMKRFLSLLLSALMIFGVVPTLTLAATTDGLSASVTDSADDDGVYLSKNVTYDPATGTLKTVIEAYTTGTVKTTAVAKPTDIILVLDVSGSMDDPFDKTQSRMNAMKEAVDAFIDATAALNESVTNELEKHAIAIVKFADDSFYGGSASITPGNHKYGSTNYTEVLSAFTTVDAAGAASLKGDVAELTAGGATAIDFGLELAMDLLDARAIEDGGIYDERNIVVIAFTDGDPTHSSGYESQVAYNAVNQAALIKASGAKLYTIGIFSGANPSGTDESNVFMNYTSSNYPLAYGLTRVEYSPMDIFQIFPETVYEINPGDAPHATGYYKTASNASDLSSIFNAIASEVGTATVSLGEGATLVDVISDYFKVDVDDGVAAITAETSEYLGGGDWATPVSDSSITADYNGVDTITLNGFNFDENFVSETARDGFYGKKIILTITTRPNYDTIDASTALSNGLIPTNDTASLCDSDGNVVESIDAPYLTANTVTYQIDDGASLTTVAEYYRFPGAEITLRDKPTDATELIYSEWKNESGSDAEDFTMPAEDVVLTSTASSAQYTVTYTYVGTVPTGTTPTTLPVDVTYRVGDTVDVPHVVAPEGYTFSGWVEDGDTFYPENADGNSAGQTFEMPAENVVFTGHFVADDNKYTVEHYLMNTDGTYSTEPTNSFVRDGVKTGDAVKADTTVAHTGFTFDEDAANVLTGTVAGDGSTVLKVYFKRNAFKVTYQYAGTQPSGAPALPVDGTDYLYGATVTLKDTPTLDGYTFFGWRVMSGGTAISADGKTLVMPNSDVVLVGDFRANGDTEYTVEHYFEDLDGTYSRDDTKTDKLTGLTGSEVHAIPLSSEDIIGFVYDATKTASDGIASGMIAGDGSLVLKLYYSRATYTVEYQIAGDTPSGYTVPATVTYKYGETVAVAPKAEVYGYSFDGWTHAQGGVTVTNGTFTMPARDVVFTGRFSKIAASYTVEHYLMGADGEYTTPFATDKFNIDVFVGDTAVAELRTFNTYEYDLETTTDNNDRMTADTVPVPTGEVDAEGNPVLKVYYARKAYSVTYKFEGVVPNDLTPPTDSTKYIHGSTVTLKTVTVPAGYTFDGWYYGETKLGVDTMEMPRNDVELVGKFTANSGVGYTVEYYFQDLVGSGYTKDTGLTQNLTGTTGEYVQSEQKAFTGFTFNSSISEWNGHIKGDGSLVLKLYYDRNVYNVTYSYFGALPADTTVKWNGTPVTSNTINVEAVRYGTTVTIKSGLTATDSNYEFRGWYTSSLLEFVAGDEIPAGATFKMPARDVEILGSVYDYVVYYDLEGGTLDGAETVDPKHVNWNSTGLLPEGTPVKDGAVFTGWKLAETTTVVTDSSSYASLAVVPTTTSIVLVAEYESTYGVTYDWGEEVPDGVTLPTDDGEYREGDSYTVDTTYTDGYTVDTTDSLGNVIGTWTFSGWTDPSEGTMGTADVVITGSWTYEDVEVATWDVTYEWTNAPDGDYAQTLPEGEEGITNGDTHTVDTTFTDETVVLKKDEFGNTVGKWTFSGWDKSGEIEVTEDTAITGSWTYEDVEVSTWDVTYEWTNAPDGDYEQTLPEGEAGITNGDTHTVDTTFTDETVVLKKDEFGNTVGKWTFSGWDKSGEIEVTEDTAITGSWTYEDVEVATWDVTYEWTNAPTGRHEQTLPAGEVGVTNGDTHTVDTTYTDETVIIHKDALGNKLGEWRFSGWDKSGDIEITEDTVIRGSWEYEKRYIPPVVPHGEVTVTKVDADDPSQRLSGVMFRLYRGTVSLGTMLGTYTTDANGQFKIAQGAGVYYLVEIRPHEGYTVNSEPIKVTIKAGASGKLVVTNEKTEVPVVFTGDHYAYIIGRDDGLVHPEANITRAEVATIFFRMLTDSARGRYLTKTNDFADVNEGDWYNTAVSTLAAMGILRGDNGNFRPDDFITRAEFAAIAARFDSNGNSSDASFTDIYEHWGQKEINTAANNGWVLGYEDGTFKPDQLITRAEAMTLVNRVLQRIPESVHDLLPDMIEWPDNMDTSKWYYLAIQEATNSHDYVHKVNGFETWIALLPVRDWTEFEK